MTLAAGSASDGRLSSAACELPRCRQPSQQLRPFLPFNMLPIASAALGTLLRGGGVGWGVYTAPCFVVCVCVCIQHPASSLRPDAEGVLHSEDCRTREASNRRFYLWILTVTPDPFRPMGYFCGFQQSLFKKQNKTKSLLHITCTVQRSVPLPG